jgi:hypothetical protein
MIQAEEHLEKQMRIIAPILHVSDDLAAVGYYRAAVALSEALEPLIDHMGLQGDDLLMARERYPCGALLDTQPHTATQAAAERTSVGTTRRARARAAL